MISVIVPVYNTAAFVEKALISILIQSYQQIEVIICDDGSKDTSARLVEDYILCDERSSIIHKHNAGLSSARETGFSLSKEEYVIFIDSDDYIDNNMLECLLVAINKDNADLSICGYYQENSVQILQHFLPYHDASKIEGRANIIKLYIEPLIGYSNSGISIPGFLWIRLLRRSLIQSTFFASERIYYLEDHVFDLLYADKITCIAIVNKPLYHYCINPSSLTNIYRVNQWKMLLNLYSFYQEYITKRNFNTCQDRLLNYLSGVFFASVDNAVNSGSYMSFLNDIKVILSSHEMKDVWLASRKCHISLMQKFTQSCCKIHCYWLIYLVRKWRLLSKKF